MQTRVRTQNLWRIALVFGLAALALWARTWIFQSLRQALGGALLTLAALPLARLLEKKLHPGLAAALALLTLVALAVSGVMLLMPLLMEQMRGLAARVPELLEALDAKRRSADGGRLAACIGRTRAGADQRCCAPRCRVDWSGGRQCGQVAAVAGAGFLFSSGPA